MRSHIAECVIFPVDEMHEGWPSLADGEEQ